jgi:hypothetical protein
MMKLFPGIARTVAEAVVKQFGEAIMDLVCAGYTVNTDTCRYAPMFKGNIVDNVWDPSRNYIQVSTTQGKRMREEIAKTKVQILGDKPGNMYIASTTDSATRAGGYTATAGAILTVQGKGLKVVDGSITLTDKEGKVTNIPESYWANNMPKKLSFFVPIGLDDGDYTLTVSTRYARSGIALNEPHVATQVITRGKSNTPGGNGGNEGGDDPGMWG